jgi:hypothetical protein
MVARLAFCGMDAADNDSVYLMILRMLEAAQVEGMIYLCHFSLKNLKICLSESGRIENLRHELRGEQRFFALPELAISAEDETRGINCREIIVQKFEIHKRFMGEQETKNMQERKGREYGVT